MIDEVKNLRQQLKFLTEQANFYSDQKKNAPKSSDDENYRTNQTYEIMIQDERLSVLSGNEQMKTFSATSNRQQSCRNTEIPHITKLLFSKQSVQIATELDNESQKTEENHNFSAEFDENITKKQNRPVSRASLVEPSLIFSSQYNLPMKAISNRDHIENNAMQELQAYQTEK